MYIPLLKAGQFSTVVGTSKACKTRYNVSIRERRMRRLMQYIMLSITAALCGNASADNDNIEQVIEFQSKSPYEFSELINNLDNSIKTKVTGKLTMPTNYSKDKRVPLIIVLDATFGLKPHHQK